MEKLLKISEFARLANTSRRTLIFYDQIGLFHPQKITSAGYRLYSYDQLYQISFILGLRDLGLSIDEIRQHVNTQNDQTLIHQLQLLDNKIEKQINHLKQVQNVIHQRIQKPNVSIEAPLYHPFTSILQETAFWCSDYSVNCTIEEIAQIYANLYSQLNRNMATSKMSSGFKTDLPNANEKNYATAGFRIIKEKNELDEKFDVPTIIKPAGKYILVKVENNVADIEKGLIEIKTYLKEHHLQCDGDLWQINIGNQITTAGFTKFGLLEYQIKECQ
ncbi:MerR family transcriptional regulator [Limosilactobacillus sp. RRLNB_1_1]|uniref:MerR family transcriptional regulator n=1 Tax=Limosilactobacillus albertensis TaxID=2759752 RepID=A0A7W3Y944_9LACO|nr:MerR family transcriptional regulator [Limosilactobacillus albertensis]MBB1070364.1 MerR family transcriptional regulator [Limosilactobacillus albertensis]MCD7117877.1 MerR family transcriptional regulator [Limosilactobacillus albertensis]MCD7128425.1 MerR family transcriptional regulator [Limosilactobacillus albertensis]